MAYNKRVLKKATKNLSKKKTLAKPKDIIKDPEGQWKFPGQPTRIPGSDITMQGVPYPVLGVGSTGQKQMMYPNQEYTFPGSTYVDEFPQDKDAMNAMMKARLAYANEFGNPAAQRMITLPDQLYDFGDGNMGSHYMASMDNYAVPQIQDVNGKLVLRDFGPESNEAIRFDRPEDAEYFAEHYKDVSPAFIEAELTDEEIEEYKKGGYVIEEIGEDPPVYPSYYTEGLSKRKNLRNLKSKYEKGELVPNPEWQNFLINNLDPDLLKRWKAEQTTPEENDLVQMVLQERKNIPMYLDQEYPEYAKYEYELLKSKYKKLDQGGFVELDLTPEEIQQYVDGGYVVEELPKAQDGINLEDPKDLEDIKVKTEYTGKYPKLIRDKQKFFKGINEYLKNFDTGKKAKYLDYDEEKTIKQNLKKQKKAYKKQFKELEKVDKIGSRYLKKIDPKYLNYTVGGLEDYGQYIDPYTRAYLMSKPDYKPEEEKTLNPYSILNTRQGYSAIRDAKNRGEISQGAWNRYLRYYGGRKFDPLRYDLTPEQQRRWEQEWGRPGEMTKFVTDYLDPLAKIIPASAMAGALGPMAVEEAAGILSTPGKDLFKYGVTGVRNFLNTAPKGAPWASIGNAIGLGFGAEAAMNLPKNIREGNDAEAIVDAVMMATSPGMPNVLSKAYNFTKALTNPTTKGLVNLPGGYTAGIKTPAGSEIYLGNTRNLTGANKQILQKFTDPLSQALGADVKVYRNLTTAADGSKELQVVNNTKTGYVPQLQLSGSTELGVPLMGSDIGKLERSAYSNLESFYTDPDLAQIDPIIIEARNGNIEAQNQLAEYGLNWEQSPTYRFINQSEADTLLKGEKINSIRGYSDRGIDVTSSATPTTGASSELRVTFKDSFDKNNGLNKVIPKNNVDSNLPKGRGYNINDVAKIEKLDENGNVLETIYDAKSEYSSSTTEATVSDMRTDIKPKKIKGLRLGVTEQDVQNVVNKNINYIKSDEYITRRMSNTGESRDEILKDIDKYINKLENATIDLNKSLLFSPGTAGLAKMRTNKIQVARGLEDKETILDVLDHEIKHMLSPATELSRSTRAKKYSTYPKIDIGGPDPYNYFKDPAEQQVRMLKLNENIRKDLGIKGDRKITKKEFDKWQASASNKILNDPAYRDFKLLYKNMSEEGKKDLLKNLNKAWGLVPPAIILGAAAADDDYSPGEIATAGLLGFITRGKVKGKGLNNLFKLSRFIGKTRKGTLLTELSKTTKASSIGTDIKTIQELKISQLNRSNKTFPIDEINKANPNEILTLNRVQNADIIEQAKIDQELHDAVQGTDRFSKEDLQFLEEDKKLKQRFIDLVEGKNVSDKEIDEVIAGLSEDKNIHEYYLSIPADANTGSHTWHEHWMSVYDGWISKLNEIKQINAETIVAEEGLPFVSAKINPEFENKNYIPIYAERAKASKTSNLPTQNIVDTYAADGDIIKLNPERVEQFEKYQDNLAKFALDFNTIWREGELGNNTKKLTKNINKLLQEQEELKRIGRPAFQEIQNLYRDTAKMIDDYEKTFYSALESRGYNPSKGISRAEELIKDLESEMETVKSSERKKHYKDAIEILEKHIVEFKKDIVKGPVESKSGTINLFPNDSWFPKDNSKSLHDLRQSLFQAKADPSVKKAAEDYDKRMLPLSWEIDAEVNKINILDILEPDVRQRIEALRDMPDPPTVSRDRLSSLETRGTLNKINRKGRKTSALAKGRTGDSSLKGTNLQDATQEMLNSISGRGDALKGAVTLRTKPLSIADTFGRKNPGTDDAIERVYEVWSKGENPQLEGYVNYTRDVYLDPKTMSETVAHEDAHVFQQLYGYLDSYNIYLDKYKYWVPKEGTKTGNMLSKVLIDPVKADPKGRQKHASWLSSPIELDANLVAERLKFARNKFIEAKQANPNATQEELLKDIIKDMKLPENRKKFIEDLMSSPEGNAVKKHFLPEFTGAIDPVKDSPEIIAGKEFARQFLEMLPVLLIGLGLGSSISGEGYKKGGSVDIELDEEQVQDYIRKGYILDEL